LERLQSTVLDLSIESECKKYGLFNAKEISGFQTIESSLNHFFVSIKHVHQYLEGYKIAFSIGNPYYATYDNIKIKLKYNKRPISWQEYKKLFLKKNYDEYSKYRDDLEKKAQEKSFDILTPLKAGTWNHVEVFVDKCMLDDLERIEFRMETPMTLLNK